MPDSYGIIKSLLRTEKGTNLLLLNKYIFWVSMDANKYQIKQAVEEIYKVRVAGVNTIKVWGKARRVRIQEGNTANWKKAIVTLASGDKIDLT